MWQSMKYNQIYNLKNSMVTKEEAYKMRQNIYL